MIPGAPNFGKTWGGESLFQPGRPKLRNLVGLIHIVSKFGGPFFAQYR